MELVLPGSGDPTRQLTELSSVQFLPFDSRVLIFLEEFTQKILSDHSLRDHPELVALAFWFRPTAISAIRERYAVLNSLSLLRPRGVALHFAPANVDSIFLYSWFLALICGNRNVIRISKRPSTVRSKLIAILAELFAKPEHRDVVSGNVVLTYPHDDTVTAYLSGLCDLRVVWGGDDSIRRIRSISLPPLATEMVFPNRQSWAVLDAIGVATADGATLTSLAKSFYNDAFWFGQQACSSPRAILWLGHESAVEMAQGRFWSAVRQELVRRGQTDSAPELMMRLNAIYSAAASTSFVLNGDKLDWPLRLQMETVSDELRSEHCGYGLFYELQRSRLDDALGLFQDVDQTVAYWGISLMEMRAWLTKLPDRAVDRIVPIGDANVFSDHWDGHDLLVEFSRCVRLT